MGPTPENADAMWRLMGQLLPIYRSLAGPGFFESLRLIQANIPLEIKEFESGGRAFDWTIPKEFKVNASYVVDPKGRRILDFDECAYHVWVYSQPFHGRMSREELVEHITTHPVLPDAVPLRATSYRDKWGLCATQEQVDTLVPGDYEVHIDTEHFDGSQRYWSID